MLDITRARAETPGCEGVIHFNNAGAALMPAVVLAAQHAHLELEARVGGYEAAEAAADALEDTYCAVAALLGARPGDIALMESATRAFDSILFSIPFEPGDHIVVTTSEYASNYIALLQVAERTGAILDVLHPEDNGDVSLEALETTVTERTRLVVLTHVPSSGGVVNPAAEVGRIARRAGALYLLDACQSAGQVSLDVDAMGCDFVVGTGRKYLRGPRGTGFLFVRSGSLGSAVPVQLDLHSADWISRSEYRVREDVRRFELFEHNVGARVGLGVAVRYALAWGVESIQAYNAELAAVLRHGLSEARGVSLLDRGTQLCGIVTFAVDGVPAAEVRRRLTEAGINTWVLRTSTTRLDLEPRGITELVRASVHYYNCGEEVERFVAAVRAL